MKILIVEDEKILADVLKLKLEAEGFEIEEAQDGEIAIQKISDNQYGLILLDLIMPNKDGFHVMEYVKNFSPDLPVIVISNLSQDEDITRAKELGAREYIVKSNSPVQNIVEKVKGVVDNITANAK